MRTKLFTVVMLVFALQVSARSLAQTVTFSGSKVELGTVFSSVEKQTGYVFFYDGALLAGLEPVSITAKNMKLETFLQTVLKNFPLKYSIREKTILISKKTTPAAEKKAEPPVDITGKVTDNEGNPLNGANVKVKGTSAGITTNALGEFSLKNVDENAVLIITYVGYEAKEIALNGKTRVDVRLTEVKQALDEVFVGAMGINRSKRTSTYAAQKVKGDDLRASNQSNLVNALQGQIAGAQISSSGGSPGLPSEIILRGVSSLTGDNQPLIIMDGIRVSNASSEGMINRLADFNPEDIEDITILKGASAAALYGIDAASGAIIITTKKGKAGKMNINASLKAFAEIAGRLPKQQKIYTVGFGGVYDPSTTTSLGRKFRADEKIHDNPKRFFQTGLATDANLNISGGSDRFNYYMSGNYRGGTATIPNTKSDKLSFLLKGTAKLSKKLELATSLQYIDNGIKEGLVGSNSGGWANSIYRYPLTYDIDRYQHENGTPYFEYYKDGVTTPSTVLSPMWRVMKNPRNSNTRRTIMSGLLSYNPLDWLKLTYRMGQDFYTQEYKKVNVPGTPGSWDGSLSETKGSYANITSTLNAIITKDITPDLNATVVLGGNNEYYWGKSTTVFGEFFQNPDIHSINSIAPANIKMEESSPRRRRYGAYGDVKLEYKKMLSLSYSGRNDWTSTLPADARSFYFSSYGGSFIFSELFGTKAWFGKIRATKATVGKDAPIYKTNFSLTKFMGIGSGFTNHTTGGNDKLKPEVTTENEYGVEVRVLKNRLSAEVTYYEAKSRDQIVSARVPLTTGFVIQTFNVGRIHNKGVEVTLNGSPVKNKVFDWNVTLNAWKNSSKMLELPDQIRVFPYSNGTLDQSAGQAASAVGYPVLGIVGTDYLRNDAGYIVIDNDGYPVIRTPEKDLYIGNREPKFNFGLINKLSYKSLSLSFLWDFRIGGDILNGTRLGMMSGGIAEDIGEWRDRQVLFNGVVKQPDGSYRKNMKEVVMNYNYFATNYYAVGTNFVEEVNWARMRYITLGYNLPKHISQRFKVNNIGLELAAQNVLLFTNYSGGDPEVNSAGPNSGAQGGSTMGIDNGAIPLTRSFSFGINVSF